MASKNKMRYFLFAVCWIVFSAMVTHAQVVAVIPQSQNIHLGDTVSIKIQAANVTGLKVYSIKVSYNKDLLKCISVEKLEFLSGPYSTFFITKIDSLNGKIQCDEAILGTGSSTGTGGLFEMKFIGVTPGISPLNFSGLDLRDITNQQITYTSTNGSLKIEEPNAVEKKNLNASGFVLYANYPNPFNPSTNISFNIPDNGLVLLEVYDLLGQKVRTLVNTEMSAGTHTVQFHAENLASGTYICCLTSGKNVQSVKMNFLK